MKTTNAKAKGFQTPAPPGDTIKPLKTNRRGSTAQKIKKAPPVLERNQIEASNKSADDDDLSDIEYMPPKPKGMIAIPLLHLIMNAKVENRATG
jgi:hypothetical protein